MKYWIFGNPFDTIANRPFVWQISYVDLHMKHFINNSLNSRCCCHSVFQIYAHNFTPFVVSNINYMVVWIFLLKPLEMSHSFQQRALSPFNILCISMHSILSGHFFFINICLNSRKSLHSLFVFFLLFILKEFIAHFINASNSMRVL